MQVPWNSDAPVVLRTEMISMGGSLYFPARLALSEDDLFSGYELVRSNGTAEGTVRVQDTFKATAHTQVGDMITHNGRVYMLTYGWLFYTAALYSTDGTPDGTYALRPHREHYEWEPVGNDLYIVEEGQPELESRWQLSKTQGTPETTEVIVYGVNWEADTQPKDLENINGVLYYFNDLGEVWKTDGTAEGTVMLKDFYSVTSITNVNGQAFIVVENQNNALEIWKTTSTGFALVKTFNNTTQGNVAVSLGGVLYFVGYQDRFQLFRSDGTGAGSFRMFGPDGFHEEFLQPYESEKTFIMYDEQLYFNTGRALFVATGDSYKKVIDEYVMKSIESNGKLFLFTFSWADGYLKAYVTDGTAENTTLLLTKPQFQSTLSATTVGKYVYFSSIWTPELWRTDGTVCSTTSVNVGTEGAYALGTLGDDLIFGGYRPATGLEPYIYHNVNRIPAPVCEPVAEAQHPDQESYQEEDILTPYPNPFSESFAINVKGKDGERARIAIYNASGMSVEVLDDVTVNTEYANIGSSWRKGFYIIKAVTKGSVITRHIVKR
jgi:ELWxxDGT repeat protein